MSQLVVCYVRSRLHTSVIEAKFTRVPVVGEAISLEPGDIRRVQDVIHCAFDNTATIWV